MENTNLIILFILMGILLNSCNQSLYRKDCSIYTTTSKKYIKEHEKYTGNRHVPDTIIIRNDSTFSYFRHGIFINSIDGIWRVKNNREISFDLYNSKEIKVNSAHDTNLNDSIEIEAYDFDFGWSAFQKFRVYINSSTIDTNLISWSDSTTFVFKYHYKEFDSVKYIYQNILIDILSLPNYKYTIYTPFDLGVPVFFHDKEGNFIYKNGKLMFSYNKDVPRKSFFFQKVKRKGLSCEPTKTPVNLFIPEK